MIRHAWPCLLLALAGCSSHAAFEQKLAGYIGRSENEVVARLGVPLRVHDAGGHRFLQYERRRVTADSYPGWGWRGGYSVQQWDCSVTFEITDGRVDSFTSRGNDCVAPDS